MTYTIKEIAILQALTTRTIRFYDEIGLLNPADTGDNGYRYYDQRKNLPQLQQIPFFRELDVPLKDIQLIISARFQRGNGRRWRCRRWISGRKG